MTRLASGRRFIDELVSDPLLFSYAWAIVAGHVVVWLFFARTNVLVVLGDRNDPICWPFFEDCWRFRFGDAAQVSWVLVAYAVLLMVAGAALVWRRGGPAWIALLLLVLFVAAIVALDYRLRANEFYMLFWLNGVFLVWPHRRLAIPVVVVSFYFWAGVLKLNYEWLSGSVLYYPLWLIPAELTTAACAYVVVLELMFSWGLLARRAWICWLALGQFALFHLQSLSQIHWFYPALMATMLSWFVLARVHAATGPSIAVPAVMPGAKWRSACVLFAAFGAFQMAPRLYRGDHVLTGQGRVFALHMFEARQVCEIEVTLHYANGQRATVDLQRRELAPRMICDPVIYFNRVQNLCRSRRPGGALRDLDVTMKARRTTDAAFTVVIDERAFCSQAHSYSLLANNRWLKAP